MNLRTTFLVTLAAVALVLSSVVFLGFSVHKGDITDRERAALHRSAETVAHDIDTRLGEKQSTVALWARHEAIADHGSARQQRALATFRDESAFEGVSVVAADGRMVAIDSAGLTPERRAALVGRNFGDRAYVRAGLDGREYVSDPFEAASGNLIVTISAPVRHNGSVVGTLNAALHLTATNFFEMSTPLLSEERALTVRSESGMELYSQRLTADERLTATATVDRTGWTVTVAADRAAIEQSLRRATSYQVLALVLTLLSVGALGIWASRLTLRQIDELIAGFDALEAGEYGTTVDLGPATEWQRISRRFADLAATLDRRTSQMLVFNRVFRHNLRNDMSVILLSAERILDDDSAPEQVQRPAERIRSRAESFMEMSEHARTVQNELLSGDTTAEAVDAVATVTDTAATLREEFPDATVRTDLADGVAVYGAGALGPLLLELGRNGLSHNDRPASERTLTLRVGTDDDTATFIITDNGPGIPPLERELLSGSREETPTSHGSGLGLWLVRWLVDALGGELDVVTAEGRGTSITVTLPLADDEPADR